MGSLRRILLLGLLLAGCAGRVPPSTPATPPPTQRAEALEPAAALARAASTIMPDELYRRIAYLASDELRGRDTPSPGLELAARFVADEFDSLGLQPAGDSGTFLQRWPFRDTQLRGTDVSLRVTGVQGTMSPSFPRDYFIMPSVKDSVTAQLAFAGTAAPGRQPPGPEAAGKVVAFYIPGAQLDDQWNAAAATAVQSSIAANAAAVLLILDPRFGDDTFADLAAQIGAQQAPAPIVGMRYDVARNLFRNGLADLDVMRAGGNRVVPVAGSMVTVRVKQSTEQVRPPNVVAVLPGSDPVLKETYIAFSAHIDHVGVGRPDARGDSIYNGADDDASGTAAIMALARAFASLPVAPARSMIFLGVSGEEKGLFGSRHFVQNPPVPAESIVANINLDMIGRNAPDTVVAIGQEYTSLGALVQEVARARPELGLVVAPDPWPEEQLFVRSDHVNFALAGIPAIFFTTGLHDDYHRPSDEVDLIDTDKLARITRLVFYLGHAIASQAEPPTWTAEGRALLRSMSGG